MSITIADSLLILAAIAGPVLAVQAQKWIERARQISGMREYVFSTLMATRGVRLDPDHVRALNMIDVAYYGSRTAAYPRRNALCVEVLDRWREYHDFLKSPTTPADESSFMKDHEELFISLLVALAAERGFEFDRLTLKKGGYHPIAMGDAYTEGNALRVHALAVLSGKQGIRVDLAPQALD